MADDTTLPSCTRCGDRIGVYERVWVELADGTVTSSSRLNLGDPELHPGGLRLWHAGCLPAERRPPHT